MFLQVTIDQIRDRIEQGILKAKRHAIVEKLLRGLGWQTDDKMFVVRKYRIGGRTIDYGLRNNLAWPLAFIEVKNISELDSVAARQIFSSAIRRRVPIFVLTDGRVWRFFHTFGSDDYGDCQVCVLDLIDGDSKTNALLLQRYLSYKSIQDGDATRAIENNYLLLVEAKHLSERKTM